MDLASIPDVAGAGLEQVTFRLDRDDLGPFSASAVYRTHAGSYGEQWAMRLAGKVVRFADRDGAEYVGRITGWSADVTQVTVEISGGVPATEWRP